MVDMNRLRNGSMRIGQRRGIQSVDVALRILNEMATAPTAMTLKALAHGTGIPASQVHRYLASFARAGYVRQDADARDYELGEAALKLGLSALNQLDLVRLASQSMIGVTAKTGLTALLSVWSERGPTIIRWERGARHVVTSLGLGSVLPALGSATGQAFLAHMPKSVLAATIATEQRSRRRSGLPPVSANSLQESLRAVRSAGLAFVNGVVIPGLRAVSSPILDCEGHTALALTLISALEPIADPKHSAALTLRAACKRLSEQAGHQLLVLRPRRGAVSRSLKKG
jgi:DNA-binding IclR family transcriptional regulator